MWCNVNYHLNLCFQVLTDKVVITNEVGGIADVLNVVKSASAKVIQLTPAPKAVELELAA